ncbi:MAG: HAMP domain-containing sensor histidine kinase [Clostridia bacterium]|nr:HAMP domain-containing sensor histidine kinase [Clostridia bacterium]
MKGITKRWVFNTLGIIVLILFVIVIAFAVVVQGFYYNSIFQTLNGRSTELVNIFNGSDKFIETARDYVENFPDKELMELMVIDSTGNVVITSTGFTPDNDQTMPDYENALDSDSSFADWHGKLNSGENVMALTRVIKDNSGNKVGAIRYIVSLEEADRKIFIAISAVCLVGILIVFFIFVSSTYFLRSIVRPVREIRDTAKKIAQGDFDARIIKPYDDEIGELCDTINYMAEELGAADKMKNDFISSVSHELRTPLTAIKGWAETMQLDGCKDQKTVEKGISIIVKEAERLNGIVEEVLDFSRIQQDRMVLIMDKIDILAELDESIYMQRERATAENKHIVYEEPEILPAVLGDKNRLRQVFINIIDNALKYSDEGGVVTVNVQQLENNIVITIADNGCGIPEKDLPKVKQKFYKANQTVRGSGIGLAVADEIMKLHNGSLDIDSTEGVGTTVTITIPAIHEENES